MAAVSLNLPGQEPPPSRPPGGGSTAAGGHTPQPAGGHTPQPKPSRAASVRSQPGSAPARHLLEGGSLPLTGRRLRLGDHGWGWGSGAGGGRVRACAGDPPKLLVVLTLRQNQKKCLIDV